MEISKQVLYEELHPLAVKQLSRDYKEKGYHVEEGKRVGRFKTDLFATKGDEKIVFVVRAGKPSQEEKKGRMAKLADYLNAQGGYKLMVVFARAPKERKIVIEGIESLLRDWIEAEEYDQVMELSAHTVIEEVTDVDIEDADIDSGVIHVKGSGTLAVQLNFDPDVDNGDNEYLPFTFEMDVKYKNDQPVIVGAAEIKIDVYSICRAEA